MSVTRLAVAACALLVASVSGAQNPLPSFPAEPGGSLRISILTFGQGDQVFERFGHNALRIQNLATGEDLAYNWGLFSFDEPQFIRRFLSGDTRYWVDAFFTPDLLYAYAQQDRHTVEQELALTPAQRAALNDFVRQNVLPDNEYYRYDYFLDNCSTRIRDALDLVLGGALKTGATAVRTELTYRTESVRLTASDPAVQAGIDIALGPRADAPLTEWEAAFIPMRLRDYLRTVTVAGPNGTQMPLVRGERVLHEARRAPELAEYSGTVLASYGLVLGVWALILTPFGRVSRQRTRVLAAVFGGALHVLGGLLGVLLLGMWVGSAHQFWYENLTLLILSPLALVAMWPVVRAVLAGKPTAWSDRWMMALTGMVVLALVVSPFVTQRLAGPLMLFAPGQLAFAFAYWRHTRIDAEPEAALTPA